LSWPTGPEAAKAAQPGCQGKPFIGCADLPFGSGGEAMSKRVTVMIDDDLGRKLRLRQAKLIQQEQASISYSRVLNETVRIGLGKS